MNASNKPLVWLHGEAKSPPLSASARVETGVLLRRIQRGEKLEMPLSRPMPAVGTRCHELRIRDGESIWRLVYRIDRDAIVIGDVFGKKTRKTPRSVIEVCRRRFREYDEAGGKD